MEHSNFTDSADNQPSEDPIARNPKDVESSSHPGEAVEAIVVQSGPGVQAPAHVPSVPGWSHGSHQAGRQPGQSPAELLASILRFKWTLILISILVSVPIIGLIWTQVVPQYTARAQVRVSPIIPRLVFRTDENGAIPFYDSYVNTQVSLIRSITVLQRVLDREDVQKTSWYQRPRLSLKGRLLGNPPIPPLERLRDGLSVRPRPKTEIIDVSMTDPSPTEAALLVDEVLGLYMIHIGETSTATKDSLFAELTSQHNSLRDTIKGHEDYCTRLLAQLNTNDSRALISSKRFDLDWAESRLNDLRRSIESLEFEHEQLKGRAAQTSVTDGNESAIRSVVSTGVLSPQQGQAQGFRLDVDLAVQKSVAKICRALGVDVSNVNNVNTAINLRQNLITPSQLQQTITQLEQSREKLQDLINRTRASGDNTPQIGTSETLEATASDQMSVHGIEAEIVQLSRLLGVDVPQTLIPGNQASGKKEQVSSLTALQQSLVLLKADQEKLTELSTQGFASQSNPVTAPIEGSAGRPQYYEDPEWRELDRNIRTLEHQMTGGVYTPNHPNMIQAQKDVEFAKELRDVREGQLDEIWEAFQKRLASTLGAQVPGSLTGTLADNRDRLALDPMESLAQQLELAKFQEQQMLSDLDKKKKEFSSVFGAVQTYETEMRNMEEKRRLFDAVKIRLEQKDMERNVPGSIQVGAAYTPSQPSQDRRVVFSVMALVLGLGTGGGIAFLRAIWNQTVYSPQDISLTLQAPFLGYVPFVDKKKPLSAQETEQNKRSSTESIRMIRTELLSHMNNKKRLSVLITSATEGTGKTTFAMMLGKSLAMAGKKVLVIDADTYKRTLSNRFDLLGNTGFIDSMKAKKVDKQDLIPDETDGLSILPAGYRDEDVMFEEIANGAFKKCVTQLYDQYKYDIILLDCPPILPVADATILASQVDGAIMVEREHVSHRMNVANAITRLGSSGGRLLGSVFVGSSKHHGYGYGFGYGYGDGD